MSIYGRPIPSQEHTDRYVHFPNLVFGQLTYLRSIDFRETKRHIFTEIISPLLPDINFPALCRMCILFTITGFFFCSVVCIIIGKIDFATSIARNCTEWGCVIGNIIYGRFYTEFWGKTIGNSPCLVKYSFKCQWLSTYPSALMSIGKDYFNREWMKDAWYLCRVFYKSGYLESWFLPNYNF